MTLIEQLRNPSAQPIGPRYKSLFDLTNEAADEIERLRAGIEAIRKAAAQGRVCDDVAWFDTITTLYDYCELLLNHQQSRVDK